jgi:DNA repair protein RecO (recombination protein O)
VAQILKSQAIILSSIRWKESSKILTLFSREWGLIKVIARGVLRKNNPVSGIVETMNLVDIFISSKQSRSLQIMTDIDLVDSFIQTRADLTKLSFSLGVLELIRQTIGEHHSDTIFFDFTIYILQSIKDAKNEEFVFVYFLLKLISFLGFKPNFSECSVCGKNPGSGHFFFSSEKGTSYCSECAEGTSLFQKLSEEEMIFLFNLQKFPHRRINEFKYKLESRFNFIQFLLDYLSFHQGHNIRLQSLNLVKK